MSIFKRSPERERREEYAQAAKRAERLSTADLGDWSDVLISEAGRHLTDWRRGRTDSLREFVMTTDALGAIADEMDGRLQ